MRNKGGLSGVITSLILIVLVMVAVGIVWVVVKNVLTEGTEEIGFASSLIDLEVKKVLDEGDTIDVTVKRNKGEGEISSLMFVVSDGVNTETIKEENVDLDELEEKRYTLNYGGLVKDISVAPIFLSESGKEKQGREGIKLKIDNEKVVENIDGLVSWWRMEGGANDEVGGNHGTLNGNVDCSVEGKYGKGCSFDGIGDSLTFGYKTEYALKEMSILYWAKPLASGIQCLQWNNVGGGGDFSSWMKSSNNVMFQVHASSTYDSFEGTQVLSIDEWNCIAITYGGGVMSIYVDGELDDSATHSAGGDMTWSGNPSPGWTFGIGGGSANYTGTLDESMVFDRALNANEVKALCNLDLN